MTTQMLAFIGAALFLFIVLPSFRVIGPTQIGLVIKRFSFKKLANDNPIGLRGEPGYQADLLKPGLRWKLWILYAVEKYPWVQIPAGEIGVVISQVGAPLPVGAKSAIYKPEFGNFTDLRTFIGSGGQKGVQRPVLTPGTLAPIHPVGFLVITKTRAYGVPVSMELKRYADTHRHTLDPAAFGLEPEQLEVTRIGPGPKSPDRDAPVTDMVGIVTTLDGDPLSAGDIASRIGGFNDIQEI